MTIKWTSDNDKILLLKILETCNVNIDAKAVAAAWPDGDEQPTPRAISERLVKIRALSKTKGNGSGSFSVKNGFTPTGTPRKSRTVGPRVKNGKAGKAGDGNGGGKRKRLPDDATDDSEVEAIKGEDTIAGANDPDASFVPASSNKKVKVEEVEGPEQKPFQLYDAFAQTPAPIVNRCVTPPGGEVYA